MNIYNTMEHEKLVPRLYEMNLWIPVSPLHTNILVHRYICMYIYILYNMHLKHPTDFSQVHAIDTIERVEKSELHSEELSKFGNLNRDAHSLYVKIIQSN